MKTADKFTTTNCSNAAKRKLKYFCLSAGFTEPCHRLGKREECLGIWGYLHSIWHSPSISFIILHLINYKKKFATIFFHFGTLFLRSYSGTKIRLAWDYEKKNKILIIFLIQQKRTTIRYLRYYVFFRKMYIRADIWSCEIRFARILIVNVYKIGGFCFAGSVFKRY